VPRIRGAPVVRVGNPGEGLKPPPHRIAAAAVAEDELVASGSDAARKLIEMLAAAR